MTSIHTLARAREEGRRLAMVTAYDVLTARILETAEVDAILVGDSVAMVVHGFPSTVHATAEMMVLHTAAVRRGAPRSLIVADLPFLAVRRGRETAAEVAGALVCAGADAVKAEGLAGHADVLAHLVGSGIPVMGHLGLTPQAVHQLGGYHVQGRGEAAAARIRDEARQLQEIGAFALVLECVPATLAAEVTATATIPTFGIGAGGNTSGQVLVVTDLLGLDAAFRPRFARRYSEGHTTALEAVRAFVGDVRSGRFPAAGEVPA
jgi:3-methyl-2-oxobutanoate hydroxymethyltransferase